MRARFCVAALFALSVSLAPFFVAPASAQQKEIYNRGKDDYYWSCLPCHGETGKGDGVMSKILVKPPADLTQLSKKNGGSFPFWTVYNIIAGRDKVPGHETLQMPDYWERFWVEEKEKGYLPSEIRILLLTHYLESIQEK